MMFSRLIHAAVLASLAASMPLTTDATLSRRDNGTEFCSVDAGCVTIHRPSDCSATYLVQSGDSCNGIAAAFNNFTLSIFAYWNPDLGSDCTALRAFVPVCINTPWYTFTPPVQKPVGTIETPATLPATDQPFPLASRVTSKCTKFELAGDGVFVFNMVQDNNITSDEFYAWNPSVPPNSGATLAGYWYCVGI